MVHREFTLAKFCRNPAIAVPAPVFVVNCCDFFLLQYICLGKVAASYEPRHLVWRGGKTAIRCAPQRRGTGLSGRTAQIHCGRNMSSHGAHRTLLRGHRQGSPRGRDLRFSGQSLSASNDSRKLHGAVERLREEYPENVFASAFELPALSALASLVFQNQGLQVFR